MTILTPTLGFIGAGRVGSTLAIALHERGYQIVAITSRTAESAQRLARRVNARVVPSAAEIAPYADLIFLTVPDDSIASVCGSLATGGDLTGHGVIHTSGVSDLAVLEAARSAGAWVGGLHPMLPVMSPEPPAILLKAAESPLITFGVEAEAEPLRSWLGGIVRMLNGSPIWLRPGQDRARYHAAGTIASNYTVTLFAEAIRLLQSVDPNLDESTARQALVHLVGNTVQNLANAHPSLALTGPIARGDTGTVQKHLAALEDSDPELATIYRLLGGRTIRIAAENGLDADRQERLRKLLEVHEGSHENHNS